MSKGNAVATPVVVWSPTNVSWVDSHHNLVNADSLRELASLLPSREVVIALSRRSTFIRATRTPNAGKADIRRILQVQLGQLFPVASHDLAFDFHVTPDLTSEGRLTVVAAVKAGDLAALHSQAREAGLKVTKVVPAAFSSPLLAKSLHQESAAVVHRTAEGLAIDLVVAGELRYSRVASMPATSLGIDAEISRTYAAAVVAKSPTIAAGSLALPDAEIKTDTWSTELLAGAHLDVSIETAELALKRERAAGVRSLSAGLAVICVAAAFLGWQTFHYLKAKQQVADLNTKGASDLRLVNDQNASALSKAQASKDLLATLDRAFHPAQSLADVLTVAANDVPKGVWLTAINVDRGKPVVLRGTSTNGNSVADYQNALINESQIDQDQNETHRFRDVKLVFANNAEVEKTPVVQFSISGFPAGNVPLVDLAAKKVVQKP